MAMLDFVIDETFVGQTIGPPDGYLVSLTMQTPPIYETPEGNDGSGVWKRGYLQMRGSRDHRGLYCSQGGHISKSLIANKSIPYNGDLIIQCVPRGSVFNLTLSDAPVVRAPTF